MVGEMSLRGYISVSVGSLIPAFIILFGPIPRFQMGDIGIGTRTIAHQSHVTIYLRLVRISTPGAVSRSIPIFFSAVGFKGSCTITLNSTSSKNIL
jgi:hypothetical protein